MILNGTRFFYILILFVVRMKEKKTYSSIIDEKEDYFSFCTIDAS